MRVVVAGATGLVGGACVRQLLVHSAVTQVTALVRKPWRGAPISDRLTVAVVDFGAPAADSKVWRGNALICALGTTMRQAGSEAAFRLVDHDYPRALAEATREHGMAHYLVVSALGADPSSRVFYNRVKGEMERDVRALGFPALTIVRPSLLTGPRQEFRPLEVVMGKLAWAAPAKWKPVHVEQVAAALVSRATTSCIGERVYENAELRGFSR
jgi:uncharacterized protein YbjT (DUF2867 family)